MISSHNHITTALFIFLFGLLPKGESRAQSAKLSQLRDLYTRAPFQEESFDSLEALVNQPEQFLMEEVAGYRACVHMLKPNYIINPVQKYLSFSNGKKSLDAILSKNSSSIELRYLRYTIQSNAPNFLGYNESLEVDREFLMTKIASSSDVNLKYMVMDFLKKQKTLHN